MHTQTTAVPNTGHYNQIEVGHEFRILQLSPSADPDALIDCKLIHATFDRHVDYEALSYVWGSIERQEKVRLDGVDFPVTTNLHTALQYLRRPHEPRYLWVDALCINQNNLDERNRHVRCMNQIYAHCTVDIMWIGPDGEVMRKARMAMQSLGNLASIEDNESAERRKRRENRHRLPVRDNRDLVSDLLWKPEAWHRGWIVQEVAYAPTVLLVAGSETITWDKLDAFLSADWYIERNGIPDAFHKPWSHMSSLDRWLQHDVTLPLILSHQRRALKGMAKGYGASLIDVMARFRFVRTTDPRDMVYALLGLCSDTLGIEVDYSRSVREIYTDCAKRIMDDSKSLDLLTQGPWQLFGNPERSDDLPSWVPDFEHPGESLILFAQRGIYAAAGSDQVHEAWKVLPDGTLVVSGFEIDTLAPYKAEHKVANPLYHPGAQRALQWVPDSLIRQYIEAGNPSLDRALLHKNSADDPIKHTPSFEDFYRTLVLDCSRYPVERLTEEELIKLKSRFEKWITTPLDDNRSIYLDFEIQELIYDIDWHFTLSAGGLCCMVPPELTQPGDVLAVLLGSKVPVVLRPLEKSRGNYVYVGPCYVHGFMDGQALETRRTDVEETVFQIV